MKRLKNPTRLLFFLITLLFSVQFNGTAQSQSLSQVTLGTTPDKDAAVLEIFHPDTGAMPIALSLDSIQLKICNQGLDTISMLPLGYLINDTFLVQESYIPGGAGFAPGDTAIYTFTQHYLVPDTVYSLCAFVVLAGDSVPENDTLCQSIQAQSPVYDVGVIDVLFPGNNSYFIPITIKALIYNFGPSQLDSITLQYNQNDLVFVTETWTGKTLTARR